MMREDKMKEEGGGKKKGKVVGHARPQRRPNCLVQHTWPKQGKRAQAIHAAAESKLYLQIEAGLGKPTARLAVSPCAEIDVDIIAAGVSHPSTIACRVFQDRSFVH